MGRAAYHWSAFFLMSLFSSPPSLSLFLGPHWVAGRIRTNDMTTTFLFLFFSSSSFCHARHALYIHISPLNQTSFSPPFPRWDGRDVKYLGGLLSGLPIVGGGDGDAIIKTRQDDDEDDPQSSSVARSGVWGVPPEKGHSFFPQAYIWTANRPLLPSSLSLERKSTKRKRPGGRGKGESMMALARPDGGKTRYLTESCLTLLENPPQARLGEGSATRGTGWAACKTCYI